jgi:hypothetical protein
VPALDDAEGFVANAAAVALLLMDAADAHKTRMLAITDAWKDGAVALSPEDVFIADTYRKTLERATKALGRLRGRKGEGMAP